MIDDVLTPMELEIAFGTLQLRCAGGFLHVVDRVTAEVDGKAESRIAAARRAAAVVTRFYDEHVAPLRKFDYEALLRDPRRPPVEFCKAMDEWVAAGVSFREWWRPFCAEHGSHVAEAVRNGVDEYLDWLSCQQAEMQPYFDGFVHDPRETGLWGPRYGGLRDAGCRQAEERALRDHLNSDAGRETLRALDAAGTRKPVPFD